jgi:hypothetical protein
MIDLFGRKRRQLMFDRAYAEFVSGNFGIAERELNILIRDGFDDFNVYNLRAQIYLASNKLDRAFADSKKSVNLQPNIDKNRTGYDIRNFIVNELKTGRIKVDLFELLNYFDISNTIHFYRDVIIEIIQEIEINHNNQVITSNKNYVTRIMYISTLFLIYKTENIIQKNNLKSEHDRGKILDLLKQLRINRSNDFMAVLQNHESVLNDQQLWQKINLDPNELINDYLNRHSFEQLIRFIFNEPPKYSTSFQPNIISNDKVIVQIIIDSIFDDAFIRNPFGR